MRRVRVRTLSRVLEFDAWLHQGAWPFQVPNVQGRQGRRHESFSLYRGQAGAEGPGQAHPHR